MSEPLQENEGQETRMARRTIRHSLKVVFSCMTALPFFVFAFVYFRIGTFSTALSGTLIALALILILQGFIIFRKMADHIERLSSTMSEAEAGGKASKEVRDEIGAKGDEFLVNIGIMSAFVGVRALIDGH
jgi:hypothetical protein